MDIKTMVKKAYGNAKRKGFHPKRKLTVDRIHSRLNLIHSEVSEATEEIRVIKIPALRNNVYVYKNMMSTKPFLGGKPCGFPSELADIIIRVGDLAGEMKIDLEKAVIEKMKYNTTRKWKHGKNS